MLTYLSNGGGDLFFVCMVGVVVDGLYIPELRDSAWMSWLA